MQDNYYRSMDETRETACGKALLPLFQDVNWKALNQAYKNKYEEAINALFSTETCDEVMVRKVMQDTLDDLKQLDYIIKGNRAKMIIK